MSVPISDSHLLLSLVTSKPDYVSTEIRAQMVVGSPGKCLHLSFAHFRIGAYPFELTRKLSGCM